MHNIGAVYYDKGDYAKALECYKLSLDIRIKIIGYDLISFAKTLDSIGLVYRSKGDYTKALECL